MARTFKEMEIEGKSAHVLFDAGSMRSYITDELTSKVRWETVPFKVGLGCRTYEITEVSAFNCAIERLAFDIEAHPVKELGHDERGRKIDAIIGALAMGKWVLTPNPETGEIDLTALRKREFIEY